MTVLFCLFVVLFARAHVRTGFALPEVSSAPEEERTRLLAQLGATLHEEIAHKTVSLTESPEGVVVSLREVGAFSSGEAAPLPAAVAVVRRIAGVVARAGTPVRVEGHTDDQPVHGQFRSNWELSTARAEATLMLLLTQPGIVPGTMSVAGYGAYRPVADNKTAEGRQLNRRVDLVLMCPARQLGGSPRAQKFR